jgi:hypothetical protein
MATGGVSPVKNDKADKNDSVILVRLVVLQRYPSGQVGDQRFVGCEVSAKPIVPPPGSTVTRSSVRSGSL